MASPGTDDPLVAALAAAAELAKNGGPFLFSNNDASIPDLAQAAIEHQNSVTNSAVATATSAAPSPRDSASFLPAGFPTHITVTPSQYQSEDDDEDDDEDGDSNNEEDAERRIARSRERNREHARRTRLRKKAQLESLQSKVKGLQAESKVLKQSLEECSIASILVGLSSGERDATIQALIKEATEIEGKDIFKLVGGKRKRFLSEAPCERTSTQPLKIVIDGKPTWIGGGRSHINWKSGLYHDESGAQRQLTNEQLESLRRERNRMHAKMTRDRKKNFISTIEKTIQELESSNQRMKAVLADVIQTHFKSSSQSVAGVTPTTSPAIVPKSSSSSSVPALTQEAATPVTEKEAAAPPSPKRVRHGFSLAM